jgi:hypothetical protein
VSRIRRDRSVRRPWTQHLAPSGSRSARFSVGVSHAGLRGDDCTSLQYSAIAGLLGPADFSHSTGSPSERMAAFWPGGQTLGSCRSRADSPNEYSSRRPVSRGNANRGRKRTGRSANRDECGLAPYSTRRRPRSPVWNRQCSTAKTPRNRGDFSGCAGVRAGSLCTHGLDGGGRSRSRTRLWPELPDPQGKYREILRIPLSGEASISDPAPSSGPIPGIPWVWHQGILSRRARIPRDWNRAPKGRICFRIRSSRLSHGLAARRRLSRGATAVLHLHRASARRRGLESGSPRREYRDRPPRLSSEP